MDNSQQLQFGSFTADELSFKPAVSLPSNNQGARAPKAETCVEGEKLQNPWFKKTPVPAPAAPPSSNPNTESPLHRVSSSSSDSSVTNASARSGKKKARQSKPSKPFFKETSSPAVLTGAPKQQPSQTLLTQKTRVSKSTESAKKAANPPPRQQPQKQILITVPKGKPDDESQQTSSDKSETQAAEPKNWAALIASSKSADAVAPLPSSNFIKPSKSGSSASSSSIEFAENFNPTMSLEDALGQYKMYENESIHVQARGLVNTRNKCFMNVILQVLLSSTPFFNLMNRLSKTDLPQESPILRTFARFTREFKTFSNSEKAQMIHVGSPLIPGYFYPVLTTFNPRHDAEHTYQEDAQEFLSFLLDKMNEELILVSKGAQVASTHATKPEEDDEWQEVGKGNRSAVVITKGEDFAESPISQIFRGKLRSSVRKVNAKATLSVQPFFCLHLDIEHPQVVTLEDAIHHMMLPESLENYRDAKTKVEVTASKHTQIDKMPPILIFHLKRFSFDIQANKIAKFVAYPEKLSLHPSYVASGIHAEARKFKLLAVVSHIGARSTDGHYVADIRRP